MASRGRRGGGRSGSSTSSSSSSGSSGDSDATEPQISATDSADQDEQDHASLEENDQKDSQHQQRHQQQRIREMEKEMKRMRREFQEIKGKLDENDEDFVLGGDKEVEENASDDFSFNFDVDEDDPRGVILEAAFDSPEGSIISSTDLFRLKARYPVAKSNFEPFKLDSTGRTNQIRSRMLKSWISRSIPMLQLKIARILNVASYVVQEDKANKQAVIDLGRLASDAFAECLFFQRNCILDLTGSHRIHRQGLHSIFNDDFKAKPKFQRFRGRRGGGFRRGGHGYRRGGFFYNNRAQGYSGGSGFASSGYGFGSFYGNRNSLDNMAANSSTHPHSRSGQQQQQQPRN